MFRPTIPADAPRLVELTAGTGFFKPHEIETLKKVFEDFFTESADEGHVCRTFESNGTALGFAYYGPSPMTLGTWELWWIVVAKEAQQRGVGGEMLRAVEADVRAHGGRLLFIDTSSQPMYVVTHHFYLKHGYEQHAVLKDYYAAGDDKIVFRKEM